MERIQRTLLVTLLSTGLATASLAQYNVTYLHPLGSLASEAHGVSNSAQTGWNTTGSGTVHASLWSGTAGSMVDLNPSGFSQSNANGIWGNRQIGFGTTAGNDHALLWSGTAASFVDLHPTGFASSHGRAISATGQAGDGADAFGTTHALAWSGTAASAVDLNPTGFLSSAAFGTIGTQQIGYGTNNSGSDHALLWNGTAASAIDLNPTGFSGTYGAGISALNQAGSGWGAITGNRNHALLWTGAASGYTDLNPAGFLNSQAWSTTGTMQTGWAWNTSTPSYDFHAMVWKGTAASAVNLHSLLSADYSSSLAFGIDATTGNIVGFAHNSVLNRDEAVMWSAVPEANSSIVLATSILGLAGLVARRRR